MADSEVADSGLGDSGLRDSGLGDSGLRESAPEDGLEPIDLEATNIPPIDFGLDTGRTPEAEIAAGSERQAEDSDDERDAGSEVDSEVDSEADSEAVSEAEDDVDDEPAGEDEDVEEFLEEHPEDAAETEDYADSDDVAADADGDYDEDGLDDETGAPVGTAVAPGPSGPRRRPRSKERKAASGQTTTAVVEHRVSPAARLVQFVQGSWRELQRVQWPDRRQVMQATGVVVGFVIVAGAFLGVADYLSTKLINFILK